MWLFAFSAGVSLGKVLSSPLPLAFSSVFRRCFPRRSVCLTANRGDALPPTVFRSVPSFLLKMSYPYYCEFFVKFPNYIPPKDPAERLVDPRQKLEPGCTAQCSLWVNEYDACTKRVRARTDNKGNCSGQYEELHVCIDRCVAKDIFKYLK